MVESVVCCNLHGITGALRFYSRASLQFDNTGLGKCRGNAGCLIYIECFPDGKRKSR